MRKITHTRAEREGLRELMKTAPVEHPCWTLLGKMDAPDLPRERTGISISEFIGIGREMLGKSLAVPPSPSGAWWAKMDRRLNDFGLTAADARRALEAAAQRNQRSGRTAHSVEWIVWRLDELLAEPPGGTGESKPNAGWTGRREFGG